MIAVSGIKCMHEDSSQVSCGSEFLWEDGVRVMPGTHKSHVPALISEMAVSVPA